ncbi:MAG: prolipoprotein diacylglyceryl transferase [Pseudomonadota bacterium]
MIHTLDPVAFVLNLGFINLGFVNIHWYGLMYLFAFLSFWGLALIRVGKNEIIENSDQVGDILFYGIIGIIIGGRLGYTLFYNFSYTLSDPISIFRLWQGGMSFHGGGIGVLIALWLYSLKYKKNYLALLDFVAPLVPIGLGAGRIGNFINGELWGKATDLPWGVVFQNAGEIPRHPTQIYECLLEGFVLFVILWLFSMQRRPVGSVIALFLICYGAFRFIIEFLRVPDPQLSYIALEWLTMGQLLSVPMVVLGFFVYIRAFKK